MAKKLLSIISAGLIGFSAITSPASETCQTPMYSLERTWLLKESESEKNKSNIDIFSSYLPQELVTPELLSIDFNKKITRETAYNSIKEFSEKIALKKSKPKEVPDNSGGFLIVVQYNGAKALDEMISNSEKYLSSLPEPKKSDFLFSQFSRLEKLPVEKTGFFQLRFGRLVPWEINYKSPTLSDKLLLYNLSEFYNNMIFPGEEACRKKTKKDSMTSLFNGELLTIKEKIDFLTALNSGRLR